MKTLQIVSLLVGAGGLLLAIWRIKREQNLRKYVRTEAMEVCAHFYSRDQNRR